MSATATTKKLQKALQHFQAGEIEQAAALDRQILDANPAHAGAWHLGGMIHFASGRVEESESHLRMAVGLDPKAVWFKTNLARVLIAQRQFDEAEKMCREVLVSEPNNPIALANLGTALRNLDRRQEALIVFEKATAIERSAQSLCNEATVLVDLGRYERARDLLVEAEKLDPGMWEVQKNLSIVMRELGKQEEVERRMQTMELLQPNSADVHAVRAAHLLESGNPIDAISTYQAAIEIDPESPDVVFGLGCALQQIGALPESLEAFRLAALLDPQRHFRASAMLYTASLCEHLSHSEIVGLHRQWGQQLEASTPVETYQPNLSTDRPLRVGYVSPDLRGHATMSFLYPLLKSHDRSAFEIVMYSQTAREDQTTESVRRLGDEWRFTRDMSDEQLASQIRADRIDILVDLAGHSADNRLPVFATKPAPIQVSFLGYPTTTGLSRIDYFLTDAVREPKDPKVSYTEEPYLLPNGACCFELANAPDVEDAPCLRNGFVTLGSTHRIEKISDEALTLWAQTLNEIPTARLLLVRDSLRCPSQRARLSQRLLDVGVESSRFDFAWELPNPYLGVYGEFDIMLDVFPWGSGTIAYDAMWMGVPIPTVPGDRAGCRATASLMQHCGHPELVASSPDDYVRLICELANDRSRLVALRSGLREQMRNTVGDGSRFARDVETAYRQFWRTYEAGNSTGAEQP